MDLELAGRTALVTGSSRGIGLAIANVLHAEGCQVVINGRDEASVASATAQLSGTIPLAGDVTLPSVASNIVAEATKKLGGCLDILVCNVGSGKSYSNLEVAETIKSLISSKSYQKSSVRGLGLFRVGQVVSVKDSPENRGMINKAKHLLEIKEQ
mgnify:CR=1 FL=1